MFSGMSSLRKEEKDAKPVELSEQQKKMQDYLKKYTGGGAEDAKKKKKRKRKVAPPGTISIVDEDAALPKAPSRADAEPDDAELDPLNAGEDAPAIANLDEFKFQMRRQEQAQKSMAAAGSPPAQKRDINKMSDGSKAGMIKGQELKHELQKKADMERRRFEALGEEQTGRAAETVYRDKHGRKVDKSHFEAERKGLSRDERRGERPEWAQGLAQQAQVAARREDAGRELSKQFIVTKEDRDLNDTQRRRTRWGDPMAHLVGRRGGEEDPAPVIAQDALGFFQSKGFRIPQEVPPHSWIKRKAVPPLNRYGIRPGRHWDGVDRSNGFEAKMFDMLAQRQHKQEQSYRDLVDDI
ncbi:unnamed protein product [Pedinophyceae sp. YPF-701]|nr:unnamed protein product [Pedinophyceae sp. YPF-701]